MSYMRGKYYIWKGDCGVQINANGEHVSLPFKIFDALVMMRFAELTEKDKKKAIKFAIREYAGNFGVDSLLEKCGQGTMFEAMKKYYFEKRRKKEARAEKK